MRFYAAWYPGDPVYSLYDDNCSMLISLTSVSNRWRLQHLSRLPKNLIIDSGGFRYGLTGHTRTQRQVFEHQKRLIKGINSNIFLCPLDAPIIQSDLTSNEKDKLISTTLANAYEFKLLVEQSDLDVEMLAIVQGYDIPSLIYSAIELKQIGYTHFGIGSLALVYNGKEILDRVRAVIEVLGGGVHLFGVTAERIARKLEELGVESVDSSRPAKAAMYNVIFSSNPFKRHRIAPTRYEGNDGPYIREPFVCDCPVCGGVANPELLLVGKRRYVFLRTLHNYYHLKQVISSE